MVSSVIEGAERGKIGCWTFSSLDIENPDLDVFSSLPHTDRGITLSVPSLIMALASNEPDQISGNDIASDDLDCQVMYILGEPCRLSFFRIISPQEKTSRSREGQALSGRWR
jgi:hypothetical protein